MRTRVAAVAVLLLVLASGCRLGAEVRTTSTNYCLTGRMANGERTAAADGLVGSVAVNSSEWPRRAGEVWAVKSGPNAGRVYQVRDHGPAARFDMWERSCAAARAYGKRTITVQRVNP